MSRRPKRSWQQDSDPAFTAMVQQELCEIARNLAQSEENLRLLLIPKDADDEKSVILEIRAGAGGEEAALVCPQPVAHVQRCTLPGAAGSARPSAPTPPSSAA